MCFLRTEFSIFKIPFEEIVSATNNFADQNFIGQGSFGKLYKGELQYRRYINIVARRVESNVSQASKEFWTEISMHSSLKHTNLISIVGFCDEDNEKIIIYEDAVNGSLDQHLSGPTLTWFQRLDICLGVAHALDYVYSTENDFSVIHCNIKSSKVLLAENWKPKLSGFEHSLKQTDARRHRLLLSPHGGTIGYVDPKYEQTGGVTHKSDVFSFGVVLFEVLCGRKAYIPIGEHDQWRSPRFEKEGKLEEVLDGGLGKPIPKEGLLAPLAISLYEDGKLDHMIDHGLWKQMHPKAFKIFSETAYYCLKVQRAERPNIDQIVLRLGKAYDLQWKHENPLVSKNLARDAAGTSSNHWKGKNLDHLKIRLQEIELATENFADTYCIGSGGYGMVYKAELEHFDGQNPLGEEERDKLQPRRRLSTVAIKRIFKREDRQGQEGFFVEIETLTSCKHPNVVSLLGFCDEGPHMILVYEHVANGSLDDYLGNTEKMTHLTWVQRLMICIDIAYGLKYIHTKMEAKQKIIHRDIKSANILLGKNWDAKIADFGLSKLHPDKEQGSTLNTNVIVGTRVYWDPEYENTGKLKKESDIYSFGVVMFELLTGRLAYDNIFTKYNEKGLAPIARQHFEKGTLKEMVDHKLKEETDEHIFNLGKGPNQDSLDTFSRIAYQCLAETQAQRPTIDIVINELKKAFYFQENHKDNLKISLDIIKLATRDFSDDNLIGKREYGRVYKGEVTHGNVHNTIAAKQLDTSSGQRQTEFLTELEILLEYKHENVIGLVGYCDEMNEKIIVYEHASRGSLEVYLNDVSFTWMDRLKVCIDIACGLEFLHGGGVTNEVVIHRDIKSGSILLNGDWKAKIADFGLSLISPINQKTDYVISDVVGTPGYCDPLYMGMGLLAKDSDIYSFGVVLFEVLCGRQAIENHKKSVRRLPVHKKKKFVLKKDSCPHLSVLAKKHFNKGMLEKIIFKGIKEQMVPESLSTFSTIAYQCLHDEERIKRPTISQVLVQLKKALELQEDHDIWEPKLPTDYKEIFQMSESPKIYYNKTKKDLYNVLSNGILLQEGKVWFSLGTCGKRNEMISATRFSYKNRRSHKWRSIPESRFQKVAEMLNVSKLKTQIKIRTQFLSPYVHYGVHLVFKFCSPRKLSSTPVYVNLTYKIGNETLHSYFATWRDDEWMMIELCRFLNHQKEADFEVLIESFSRYHCKSGAIYVEGIEFRAIENDTTKAKHEEITNLKEDQVTDKTKDDEIKKLKQVQVTEKAKLEERTKLEKAQANDEAKEVDIEKLKIVQDIDNPRHEEVKKFNGVQNVLKSKSKIDKLRSLPSEINRKNSQLLINLSTKKNDGPSKINRMKDQKLSAVDILNDRSNEESFNSEPSARSRFETNCEKVEKSESCDQGEKLMSLGEVDKNEKYVLLAKEALYDSSNPRLFSSPSSESRSHEVVELLSRQVFCIKCKIENRMLSPNKEYVCSLVFKLSENCHGLHCPVRVRDLNCWKKKESGILYLRSPCPLNLYDGYEFPRRREDGWMEVTVWKFVSKDLRNDYFPINLKLICYEGTMSGLILYGFEFRQYRNIA